jgi:PAS domain S-box-containing protein
MARHSATEEKYQRHEVKQPRKVLEIARNLSATIGAEFFGAIARHLARELGADCVYIGEFAGGHFERVRTLAAYADGKPARFDFPLAGSAAAHAALGKACIHRAEVQKRFPDDSLLRKQHAQACLGMPLLNSRGRPFGLIMVIYRQPVTSLRIPKSMLEIFAPRASAELERKQEEERLRESEQRYRAFVAENTDSMWRIEFEEPIPTDLPAEEQLERIFKYGYIAECNDSLARLLGLDRAERLIGGRVAEISRTSPWLPESFRAATLAAIRRGYRFETLETAPSDHEGNVKHMLRTHWGIVEQGLLKRMWGIIRDITALRHAEEALNASERRLASLLDTVHLAVVVLDSNGMIAFCNDYLCQLTGWKHAEVLGKDWLELMVPAEERANVRSALAKAKSNPQAPVHFEGSLVGPAGRRWRIAWDSAVLSGPDGQLNELVNVGRDTSEYKALEDQFRQAQKLESIGRLAGGVAHDFNNLLTVIIGYCEVLLRNMDQADPSYNSLTEIRKAAEKGAQLTHQLLTFSRRQVLRPDVLNLNTLVEENERMLRRLIGEDINLVTNLDPKLGMMRADAGHIHQVLLNLSVNARDAMPRGGRLTIASSNVEINDPPPPGLAGVPPGKYVELSVTDTGHGMSEEVRAHLFEPFFTTKEPGKGTGLGLSTVYGIIQQSGGQIRIETEPEKGMKIRILLPRVEPETASDPEMGAIGEMPKGAETILLVEDQEEVRTLAVKILRELGYSVLEAESPGQALEFSRQPGSHIDLIVTDLVMPGMGGGELADLVRASHRGVKVLFISGYTEAASVEHRLFEPGFNYLQKPFTPRQLALKLRETLDQS